MKKKIIGIILTLTMVLTMLPALALPTKAEDSLPETINITKGGDSTTIGKDYSVEGKAITILTDGCTVSGTATNYRLIVGNDVKQLTINGLKLDYDTELGEGERAIDNRSSLEIIVKGENQIGNSGGIWYLEEGIYVDNDLTITGDGTLTILSSGYGIVGGEDVIIKDVTIKAYSKETMAIEAKRDLTISGNAKIEASSENEKMDSGTTIGANNISIEGKADVSSIANASFALKAYETKIEISSSGSIKICSENFIALSSEKLIIGENVKDLVLYGSYEEGIKVGAVWLREEPEKSDISEKLTIYGGVDVDFDFNPKDIVKEENKARIGEVELPDEDGDKDKKGEKGKDEGGIYTCFVGDEVANALVIRNIEEPTTPENPKTEDTNSMLMWIVLGLASLAIAAGILLSKKQKN